MKCVSLVQVGPYRWKLISPTGHVMVDDLMLQPHRAEEWVKGYISSFNGWNYKIVRKVT